MMCWGVPRLLELYVSEASEMQVLRDIYVEAVLTVLASWRCSHVGVHWAGAYAHTVRHVLVLYDPPSWRGACLLSGAAMVPRPLIHSCMCVVSVCVCCCWLEKVC